MHACGVRTSGVQNVKCVSRYLSELAGRPRHMGVVRRVARAPDRGHARDDRLGEHAGLLGQALQHVRDG